MAKGKKFYKKKQPKTVKGKTVLPHNSRKIPAISFGFSCFKRLKLNSSVKKGVFFGLLMFSITLFGLNLFMFYRYQELKINRVEHLKSLSALEKLINSYPASSQTYYTAAIEAARLKDQGKALYFLDKALFLNPNLNAAKELQQKLLK